MCFTTPHTPPARGYYRNSVREALGGRGNAAAGSGRNGLQRLIRTTARTHFALTSSRPGHTGVPSLVHKGVSGTPLVRALALQGVSGTSSGSHLGSTLKPGGAVLTLGVSRRSGSVACVPADASPSEVLARSCWPSHRVSVKRSLKFRSRRSPAGGLYIRPIDGTPRFTIWLRGRLSDAAGGPAAKASSHSRHAHPRNWQPTRWLCRHRTYTREPMLRQPEREHLGWI